MGPYRTGLDTQMSSRAKGRAPGARLEWSRLWSQTSYVPWTSAPVL